MTSDMNVPDTVAKTIENHPDVVTWFIQDPLTLPIYEQKQNQIKAYLARDFSNESLSLSESITMVKRHAQKLGWATTPSNLVRIRKDRFLSWIKEMINHHDVESNLPNTEFKKMWQDFSIPEEVKGKLSSDGSLIVLDQRWTRLEHTIKKTSSVSNILTFFYNSCSMKELDTLGW